MKALITIDTETDSIEVACMVTPDSDYGHKVAIIGETYKLGSRPYDTGRGRRLWDRMIAPEYRELAEYWTKRCRSMYGHQPKEMKVDHKDMICLDELFRYCMSL